MQASPLKHVAVSVCIHGPARLPRRRVMHHRELEGKFLQVRGRAAPDRHFARIRPRPGAGRPPAAGLAADGPGRVARVRDLTQ
jgi:hypothetical protein